VTKDELENIALESTRTIDIDEFGRAFLAAAIGWPFCIAGRQPPCAR
jgi:hypothetical protein